MAFEHKLLYVGSGKLYERLTKASTRIPGNPFELTFYARAVEGGSPSVSDGLRSTFADTSLAFLEDFLGRHSEYKGILFEYALVKNENPRVMASLKNASARKIGVVASKEENNLDVYDGVVRIKSKCVFLNFQEGLEALVKK